MAKQPDAQWPTTKKDWWPLNKIKPYEKNPRTHPKDQIALLATMMKKFGVDQPIVVDEKGVIIKGHGRLQAAYEAGFTSFPVVVHRGLSAANKQAMRIADNQVALLSGWDDNLLRTEMTTLSSAGFDMALTGFDGKTVDRLIGTFATPTKDPDDRPPLPKKTYVKKGDLFILGEHKILCGDATDKQAWGQLMGDRWASMVFTDPPYGVSYLDDAIKGDSKRRDELFGMLVKAFKEMVQRATETAAYYIWHASSTRRDFEQAMQAAGLMERQYLIWAKPSPVLGHADYQWAHEPCFYASDARYAPTFYGDRAEQTVWRIEAVRSKTEASTVLGSGVLVLSGTGMQLWVQPKAPKGKKVREVRLTQKLEKLVLTDGTGTGTVWEVSRDQGTIHPTQKPVALATRAIENSSRPGDIVADGFSGSGTTLIACELTGRRARVMELDPIYVQAAVERWEQFTGGKAVKPQVEQPKKKAPRRAARGRTEAGAKGRPNGRGQDRPTPRAAQTAQSRSTVSDSDSPSN
jgi:DNA modification methylase